MAPHDLSQGQQRLQGPFQGQQHSQKPCRDNRTLRGLPSDGSAQGSPRDRNPRGLPDRGAVKGRFSGGGDPRASHGLWRPQGPYQEPRRYTTGASPIPVPCQWCIQAARSRAPPGALRDIDTPGALPMYSDATRGPPRIGAAPTGSATPRGSARDSDVPRGSHRDRSAPKGSPMDSDAPKGPPRALPGTVAHPGALLGTAAVPRPPTDGGAPQGYTWDAVPGRANWTLPLLGGPSRAPPRLGGLQESQPLFESPWYHLILNKEIKYPTG
ncbi:basic proline-rich protein-like [Homarus americanus]|uniref:basic proline-rich protein-like n=1 Tax=Homarus americanus TaxID=6706 RepID=UPI001C44EBE7|nr:basic proline-rich protein-like [Homarus americanus]